MCRLLGWTTREPTTLRDLLGSDDLADFTELSVKHGDGWGVARTRRRGVAVRKSADAARTSAEFARWAHRRRTDSGIAHLRWATMGLGIGTENTHPFTDRRIAFAHNGSIRPPAALDELLSERSQRRRRGTTDSERYFLAVAERLRDGATPAEALRTTADELHAFCRFDPDGELEDRDPEYYTLRYRIAGDAVVVSSSGWGRDWQELGNGDLLTVRRRTLDTSVVAGADLGVPS
jgi:predicted glutamine amidotransferase